MSQLSVEECILSSAPKSCELDPIPSKLLIECLDSILPSLTYLFNYSLASGIFPQCFKSALFTPILKKKRLDHNDLNDWMIGFTDTVFQWFSSYLTDRTHYVSLFSHCSAFTHVHSDVPQCSVHGPMIFKMYIEPLSAIIDSHSIIHHSFADDLQLQMSAPPDRISELLHPIQSCISDVKAWATANKLRLNDKTELMLVTSKITKHLHNLPISITIGNAQITFNKSVKNLGFALDCHLTMNANVSNIARTCYFELRRSASIRRFLSSIATATLVSAFVL